jgi:hypothetical protein
MGTDHGEWLNRRRTWTCGRTWTCAECDDAECSALLHGARLGTIRFLVEQWPDALRERAGNGDLAIRVAAGLRRTDALPWIEFLLVQQFPESIKERDGAGRTPLHVAASRLVNLDVFTAILQMRTHSAREQDDEGNPPLHLCCFVPWRDDRPREARALARVLLRRWPELAHVANHRGELPLQSRGGARTVGRGPRAPRAASRIGATRREGRVAASA